MFDIDAVSSALDALGYDGMVHVSRYLAELYGDEPLEGCDEELALAYLGRLTDEERASLVGYFGGFVRAEAREVASAR